ncbi:MAG: homoserine O-succinyltransferase, partial [Ruminococcus sp.]|nr:homoserine O-succinyltransferase [Ruminococcus sp.]
MPIRISSELPAFKTLGEENIFVMSKERAEHQDIRPLRVIILNIMPKKIETESQLMRLLSNTPLQVDVELLQMASHVSRNTSSHHLDSFYKTFDEISDNRYDGMIITGAPVELLDF